MRRGTDRWCFVRPIVASVLRLMEPTAKEADLMMRKTLSAFALIAAFGATAFVPASAYAQDAHDRAKQERRVYDRTHRDYHVWNNDEDHVYREYLTQHHRKYRTITRLSKKQQQEYWNWRHDHR
jgi:ABC-type nickel/cobalt efflux system permease component RcnA